MFDWPHFETKPDESDRPARVAVIAVHGIADPRKSETNTSIADLLTGVDDQGPAYDAFVRETLEIPVRRLPVPDRNNHQKYDFGEYVARAERETDQGPRRALDAGLIFTASLLACYNPDGKDGTYHTTVLRGRRLPRAQDTRACGVDVFEMYWADLSRVTGGLTRIFAEFCQLLLHLESLGAHAVRAGEAADANDGTTNRWRRWAGTQQWAASILTREILVFNLFVAGLLLAALGGLPGDSVAWQISAGTVSVAAAIGVAAVSYRTERGTAFAAVGSVLAAGSVWMASRLVPLINEIGHRALTTLVLTVSAALIWWIVTAYERQRPRVWRRAVGYGLPLLAVVLFELWTIAAPSSEARPIPAIVLTTVLHGVEIVYAALCASWIVFLLGSWLAFWFGRVIVRQASGIEATRLAALNLTARFTLAAPAALFLLTTVGIWAALWLAFRGQFNQPHVPLWPSRLLDLDPGSPTVDSVITALLLNATPALGPLVALLTTALMLVVLGMAPSALAELHPPKNPRDGIRNGQWLSSGFHLAKLAGRIVIVSVLVVLPAGLVAVRFGPSFIDATVQSEIRLWNTRVLIGFGSALLAFTIAMVMFGERLRALTLGFRNAVDAVLDVDNYFREHPRSETPRARIGTRLGSLLRHVYAQDYDAVVIIAESQGAVIAGDVLRFIEIEHLARVDSTLAPAPGTRLFLFTVGAPLRQAYGLRFPHLYAWARQESIELSADPTSTIAASTAPDPNQLGVSLWVNAYRSGDYVGRNLWRSDDAANLFDTPAMSAMRPWPAGAFPIVASQSAPPPNRREFCIGAGGHTHYRDSTAPQIALELDSLIRRCCASTSSRR